MTQTLTRPLARILARSPLLSRGKRLFENNTQNWHMQLSRTDKLAAGLYIILKDHGGGLFPPKFEDQAKAYAGEVNYRTTIQGKALDLEKIRRGEIRKPFWFGHGVQQYLRDFQQIARLFQELELAPPARLLELGCGAGWTAEFLATMGYDVVGTSIAPLDIADANIRVQSLNAKGLNAKLRFEVGPMESVAESVGPRNHYDAVFVYEALHHAFDWRRALESSFACLRPGGWVVICSEPNVLHTCISYRVAKLSNTHEIGFSRRELVRHLARTGYAPVKYCNSLLHFWVKHHWIAAQKPR